VSNAWIGVDFDGTLAEYPWKEQHKTAGNPVKPMLDRVKRWIRQGIKVKIMTARANYPYQRIIVEKWLVDNGIGGLEITSTKDHDMMVLFDDKAITVEANTGRILAENRLLAEFGIAL